MSCRTASLVRAPVFSRDSAITSHRPWDPCTKKPRTGGAGLELKAERLCASRSAVRLHLGDVPILGLGQEDETDDERICEVTLMAAAASSISPVLQLEIFSDLSSTYCSTTERTGGGKLGFESICLVVLADRRSSLCVARTMVHAVLATQAEGLSLCVE